MYGTARIGQPYSYDEKKTLDFTIDGLFFGFKATYLMRVLHILLRVHGYGK